MGCLHLEAKYLISTLCLCRPIYHLIWLHGRRLAHLLCGHRLNGLKLQKVAILLLTDTTCDKRVSYWQISGKCESRHAKSAEWKSGISCPDLHSTSKHLQTVMWDAAVGQILSLVGVRRKGHDHTSSFQVRVCVCVCACEVSKVPVVVWSLAHMQTVTPSSAFSSDCLCVCVCVCVCVKVRICHKPVQTTDAEREKLNSSVHQVRLLSI